MKVSWGKHITNIFDIILAYDEDGIILRPPKAYMGKLMKSRPVYKTAHLAQWSLEYQSTSETF